MSFWYVNSPPERAAEQRNESFGILSYVKKAVKLQSPMNPFFVSSRNNTQKRLPRCLCQSNDERYQMKYELTRGKIAKKTNNAKPDKKPSIAPLTKALSSRTAGEIGKCKAGVRTPKDKTKFKPGEKLQESAEVQPLPFYIPLPIEKVSLFYKLLSTNVTPFT